MIVCAYDKCQSTCCIDYSAGHQFDVDMDGAVNRKLKFLQSRISAQLRCEGGCYPHYNDMDGAANRQGKKSKILSKVIKIMVCSPPLSKKMITLPNKVFAELLAA